MKPFVYVFSEDERDKLLRLNYTLLKADDTQSMYVFANKARANFDSLDVGFVLSDTLTF